MMKANSRSFASVHISCRLARPQGYKTFFMLNSAEHEILLINLKLLITANCFNQNIAEHEIFSADTFVNMKMPTIVGIFMFISRENFMLR